MNDLPHPPSLSPERDQKLINLMFEMFRVVGKHPTPGHYITLTQNIQDDEGSVYRVTLERLKGEKPHK